MSSPIHVALAFDQNYLMPAYALITSIFENNKNNVFAIHIMTTGVEESDKSKLIAFAQSHNSAIKFYVIDDNYVNKTFGAFKELRFGLAAYYRLLFPSVLPAEVKRYIYLDTDVIVVGSLQELYNIDIHSFPLGACAEPFTLPQLGMPIDSKYFNSGVILVDKEAWIEQDITTKAIKFLHENPEKIFWADQDALNAVLVGNWEILDNKFNVTAGLVPSASKKDLDIFLKTKVVIHYNQNTKPWHRNSESPLRYLYHEYFKKSPIGNKNPYMRIKFSFKNLRIISKNKLNYLYINNKHAVSFWRAIKNKIR